MLQLELKDWLPLAVGFITASAALFGVALSGYFAHRNTHATLHAQRKLRADEQRLERMEELFVVFERWELNFSHIYMFHLRRHKGLLTALQVQELILGLPGLQNGEIHRMAMLLRLHFPGLDSHYAAVQKARKTIVPFLDDLLPVNFVAFIQAQESFEATCHTFKKSIAKLPRFPDQKAV